MTDTLSKEQRHKVMSAIRGANTKPEIIVRKFLWSQGYRYRLNYPRLPGKPDIVLKKYRTCIFVNGCFWHGHEGCKSYVMPKTHTDFWQAKIERNRKRDAEVCQRLLEMGWNCVIIWECQLKSSVRHQTLNALLVQLNRLFIGMYQRPEYESEEAASMVAEEEVAYGKTRK